FEFHFSSLLSHYLDSCPEQSINKIVVGTAKGPNLKNVRSKIGSLNNVHHKPAGGDKKIESQKLNWETKSRVGSLDNATHKPQGGKVKVTTQKLEWNVKSKVGSFDNVKHVPGGGNVKIFDEKYVPSMILVNSSTDITSNENNMNSIDQNDYENHHHRSMNYDCDDRNHSESINDLIRTTNQKLQLEKN
ncbi:microtubule-associated protein tau-like protein, partial [Sarcoptes scabiei]